MICESLKDIWEWFPNGATPAPHSQLVFVFEEKVVNRENCEMNVLVQVVPTCDSRVWDPGSKTLYTCTTHLVIAQNLPNNFLYKANFVRCFGKQLEVIVC